MKTHCRAGHEFTPENTYRAPKTGFRNCRVCRRASERRYQTKASPRKGGTHRRVSEARRRASAEWPKKHPERYRALLRSSRYARYGLTLEDYERMHAAQEGLCAICRLPERAKNKRLAVDHDHATGVVRGLLCMRCNQALGMFDDNPASLGRAIEYLTKEQKPQ